MWTRKELKKSARLSLRKVLWHAILVCFILMIFTNMNGEIDTRVDQSLDIVASESDNLMKDGLTNKDILDEITANIYDKQDLLMSMIDPTVSDQTKGLIGSVFNDATKSGSFLFGFLNAVNHLFFGDGIMPGVIVSIGLLLSVLYWLFVSNVLRIGECRYFLEARRYEKTEISRVLFLYKIHTVLNPTRVLLIRTLLLFLWFFTLVGFPVKIYSYRMIPYILAENPDIHWKEAFSLSRQMMHGNKWRVFVLDLSFILWYILNALTFGLLGIFYLNPYYKSVNAELYMVLRENAIINEYAHSDQLIDEYLTAFPEGLEEYPAEQYPAESYPIEKPQGHKWISNDYSRKYSVINLILIFFTFSIFGWCWEVALHLLQDGEFVNRGTLMGPWLPIYGSGGIMVVVLLRRFAKNPALTFVLSAGLCAVVEYATGWYLDTFKHMEWWDYSGYFLNINGYICLESVLTFGLGGLMFIYLFAPSLDNLFDHIPRPIRIVLCAFLVTLFGVDFVNSHFHPNTGEGITKK